MTIQTQTPWRLKALYGALGLLALGAVGLLSYQAGRGGAPFGPGAGQAAGGVPSHALVERLTEQVEQLTKERDALATGSNAAESKWTIERSAQKQLAAQVKDLESEKTKLAEDLAFFESLLPAGAGGVAIRRLTVEMDGPNQLRYRVLAMQGGKGQREFNGNLQLLISTVQGGKPAMIPIPDAKATDADKYRLAFKHYQRLEGTLALPEGTTVKSVQARILERGQVRAQQSANL